MGIFFCPRLRGHWKKPDPPGTGPSYPLHPVTSPPDGVVGSGTGSAPFASRVDALRLSSTGTSAGGLSEKLRKRFSREHKKLHGASIRAEGRSGSSTLHGPARFPSDRLDNSSVGLGGSLLSERGYDSDAQFISTPKQINHQPECFVAEPASLPKRGKGREGSPAASQASDVSKGVPVRAPGFDPNILEGTRNPWSSMDQAIWNVHPTANPPPFSRVASSAKRRVQAVQPYHAGFCSPKSTEYALYDQQDRYGAPPRTGTPKLSNALYSSSSTPGYHEYGSKIPGYTSPAPSHYTTSVDSLAGSSAGLSVRTRRRQVPQTATGNGSVHLEDMDIHTMLASRTTSPRILSGKQSLEANPWASDVRLRKSPQPAFDSNSAMSNGKVMDVAEPTYRFFPQETSSCYSRPESQHSAASRIYLSKTETAHGLTPLERQSQRSLHPTRDCTPRLLENMLNAECATSRPVDGSASSVQAPCSKSVEQIHSDLSVASSNISSPINGDADLVSPRKVSVGWMSGGRRLGYGYTLVPASEENDRPSGKLFDLSATHDLSQEVPSETDTQAEQAKQIDSQPEQHDTTSLSKKAGMPIDLSSIIGHINFRSWSGATNATAGDESPKSSLLGRFSKKKRDHSDPEPPASAKDPWDFCAWVNPNQSLSEQQPPLASPSASSMSTEGRGVSLGRWSTLRRTGSLWAKGRSMSAIARDLEAKAAAKLNASTGRFPVMQKKDGRATRFKVLDRKRRAHTEDDGEPMVPLKQWSGEKDTIPCREGDGASIPSVDLARKQFSEQTGSTVVTDGWESNYQDCEEIFAVGE
ncbi:uncharacterized protein BP01DRAFT_421767 [Aspergillus saccharolyticus JOP 1030-1]|uniref:Uncharacterized protein n=1 Tax=Aspergillus saccharolyticus JOP 1030-1 TaxID=1450539 RepID=A0A318ZL20_9EURO|nr:hypothetical protein BP01DRAFT_421767 [Aspergillus saccharolyticus JOP 1030-1]PYH47465.1 hypothetical protein BP01DRAFT_421767 [Aspergillus saccharolyticus JOP 1030-1]